MQKNYRVERHPILGDLENKDKITFFYNDQPIEALAGEPIASALMNAGIRSFRTTAKNNEPRGVFCAIGRCTDCMMMVDGRPNIRTCVTRVEEGMRVETQYGFGYFKETSYEED